MRRVLRVIGNPRIFIINMLPSCETSLFIWYHASHTYFHLFMLFIWYGWLVPSACKELCCHLIASTRNRSPYTWSMFSLSSFSIHRKIFNGPWQVLLWKAPSFYNFDEAFPPSLMPLLPHITHLGISVRDCFTMTVLQTHIQYLGYNLANS